MWKGETNVITPSSTVQAGTSPHLQRKTKMGATGPWPQPTPCLPRAHLCPFEIQQEFPEVRNTCRYSPPSLLQSVTRYPAQSKCSVTLVSHGFQRPSSTPSTAAPAPRPLTTLELSRSQVGRASGHSQDKTQHRPHQMKPRVSRSWLEDQASDQKLPGAIRTPNDREAFVSYDSDKETVIPD